jgi:hypothetical protein
MNNMKNISNIWDWNIWIPVQLARYFLRSLSSSQHTVTEEELHNNIVVTTVSWCHCNPSLANKTVFLSKTFGSEDDNEDRDFDESSATARRGNAFYLQKMQLELFLSIDLLQLLQSDSFDPQTLE